VHINAKFIIKIAVWYAGEMVGSFIKRAFKLLDT